MSRVIFRLAAISACLAAVYSLGSAQDFQKSYQVGAGGHIAVKNVSGDVSVTGYDGTVVLVSGTKEGRDREQVEVEDLSSANQVDVRVRYPKDCNCEASIRFEVKVPRSTSYIFDRISTASGDVSVQGVSGELNVSTASGDVEVTDVMGRSTVTVASGDIKIKGAAGSVTARSASGDVSVEIVRLESTDSLEFTSASGDVNVSVPASIDADVEMSTLSGSLKTDFPIQVEETRHGPGRRASGRVGAGARRLKISTVSGSISLTRT
jgi:DUF4097 and DUF4098 domain-containing protein YvlB